MVYAIVSVIFSQFSIVEESSLSQLASMTNFLDGTMYTCAWESNQNSLFDIYKSETVWVSDNETLLSVYSSPKFV